MTPEQHFSFEGLDFEEVVAHDGRKPIRFCRVRERADGTIFNFLDFSVLPAGSDVGLHTHAADNEEVYIIVSGRGRMALDGGVFEVGPGHVVMNRPGGTHGLENVGDEELRMVVIEAPVCPRG